MITAQQTRVTSEMSRPQSRLALTALSLMVVGEMTRYLQVTFQYRCDLRFHNPKPQCGNGLDKVVGALCRRLGKT